MKEYYYNTSVVRLKAMVRLTLGMIPFEVSVAWQPETLVKGFPTSLISDRFQKSQKIGVYLYTCYYLQLLGDVSW